jgi:hypothetical protein
MNREHLVTLYNGFGIVLLVISLNTWLASQGGKAILNIPLINEERPAMSFFGLMLGSVLLFLMSAAGLAYARRTSGPWHARIPPVWLKDLDTSGRDSQIFLVAALIIFVGVPLGAFYHFLDIVLNSKLCVLGSNAQPVMVSAAWFHGISNPDNQIRLVADLSQQHTCDNGIQVFPGWEFLLVWLAIGLAVLMTAFFLLQILFLRPASRRKDVDGRDIGKRSDAVLRTATPGHDA